MRDVINQPTRGSYTYTFVNTKGATSGYTAQTMPGVTLRGRSDIVQSNGVTATHYNAYRANVRGGWWQESRIRKYAGGKTSSYTYEGYRSMPPLAFCLDHISMAGYEPILPYGTIQKVKNRLLSEAADIDWNAANTIGELRTTAQMICSTVAAALRAAAFARKGQWGKAWIQIRGIGSLADKAANTHLAVQYGWKPLISDVQGAMKALDKGMRDGYVNVKATQVETSDVSARDSRYTKEGTWTVGAEGGLTFKVRNPNVATAGSLGLTNPLSLGWELLPLSFVVDWFLAVGDWLKGLGATVGLTFVSGYITEFVRTEKVSISRHDFPRRLYEGSSPEWSVDAFAMKRVSLSTWPRPGLVLKLGLNLNQLASAVALIKQRT